MQYLLSSNYELPWEVRWSHRSALSDVLSFGSNECLRVLAEQSQGIRWSFCRAATGFLWLWDVLSLGSGRRLVMLAAPPREGGWSSRADLSSAW